MVKELLFSVPGSDLHMNTFTVSGAGGQGRDHVNTGVRFVHPPSGATGEGRSSRYQRDNRREALKKLTQHPKFVFWVHEQVQAIDGKLSAEKWVEQEMKNLDHFKFEVKDEQGRWVDERPGASG